MKPGPKKPRSWVLTILVAVAAIVYVAVVFLPGQRAIGKMRKQLHEKQHFIVQADRLTFAVQKANSDLRSAHDFAEAWRSAAPAEGKLAATLGRITEHATTAGLAVHRFDPQPVVKLDTVWHAPVLLVAEGEFAQVFEFLRSVELLPSVFWVQQLRLESAGKPNGRLRFEATLMVFADNRDFSE